MMLTVKKQRDMMKIRGDKMKKIMLLLLMLLLGLQMYSIKISAEDIYYPFDSITIVEAYKFTVEVTTEVNSESLLYGHVEIDDILTIYVGTLEFISDGVPSSGSANILIVTGADNIDIARFLINNYTYYPDISRSYGFASHILIDPLVGVHKDMSIQSQELAVIEDIANSTFSFVDNKGLQFPAMTGSYVLETDLSIQISAYTEAGE